MTPAEAPRELPVVKRKTPGDKHVLLFIMSVVFVCAFITTAELVVYAGGEPMALPWLFDLQMVYSAAAIFSAAILYTAAGYLLLVSGCRALDGSSCCLRVHAWLRKRFKRDRSQAEFYAALSLGQVSVAVVVCVFLIFCLPGFLEFVPTSFLVAILPAAILVAGAGGLKFRPLLSVIFAAICGAIAFAAVHTA